MSSEPQPLVSIVVAVMNGEKTLERCIASIAAQTWPAKELLIKDGGSTDGTMAIVARWAHAIAFSVSTPDRGIYDAWNSVIDECHGDWICFLGCDDEFAEPTSLESLVAAGRGSPAPDLVCARAEVVDDTGRAIGIVGRPWNWTEMKRAQLIAHPGMLHRTELLARHGRFDTSFAIAGDYEFLLRMGSTTRAAFVDRVAIRQGGSGMSRKAAFRAFRESWRAQARHPEIGRARATFNYGVAVAKLMARRLLGRA